MKSINANSVKTSLFEQDANLTTFRKRNKILILIFLLLIISLTLILGVLITYFVHDTPRFHKPSVNPAVKAFCDVADNTSSCIKAFNTIISVESRTDPNQILSLSLSTSAKQLENIISFLSTSVSDVGNNNNNKIMMIAFKNCSDSLQKGLVRIRDALATMRVDPFVEMQSDEQRVEMMNKIMGAEENLNSCLDDLGRSVESTAVISEVTAKVHDVKVYVNSSGGFLLGYAGVLRMFNIGDGGMIDLEIFMCMGVQLLFMFFLFWSLFRIR